jgi:hypothetical protein
MVTLHHSHRDETRRDQAATRPARLTLWLARVTMVLALAAMTAVAAWQILPPDPDPPATPNAFSTAGAMQDLEVVAAEPHPIGSPAQEVVRDYIVAQAAELGLQAEVQSDAATGGDNLVVRLPGTNDDDLDVLITAHYDSAPGSPGAGDNGVSVVAMLEAMRVLSADDPLANDIVFLFTDGEERGQTGIASFLADYPAADQIAVSFVFDSMPDSSGTEMHTTTPGDAWLVDQVARASLPIFANSATNTSDRDRIGTDFAAFEPAGIVAAEFITEGGEVRYHSAVNTDSVDAVDPGAVRDQGETMVGLARHFGKLGLTSAQTADHDLVFVSAPLLGLVHYPVWLARTFAFSLATALVLVVAVSWRRRRTRGRHVLWGALLTLGLTAALTAAAWGTWQALLAMNPESADTIHYPDFAESTRAMVAVLAVAGAVFVAVCHLVTRWLGTYELTIGAVMWWAVVAVLLALQVPLFSPIALWPLLGGVATIGIVSFVHRLWPGTVLLALAAVPGLVVLIPLLVLDSLDVENGPLGTLPGFLFFLGSILPQLMLVTGRWPAPEGPTPALEPAVAAPERSGFAPPDPTSANEAAGTG